MSRARARLEIVRSEGKAPPAEKAKELGLYAEIRKAALDAERWRRMHIRSDRSEAITLAAKMRRICSLGSGVRVERGGFKFEERL